MQTFKRKWQGVFFTESGTTMPRGSMGMSLAHSFHNLMKRVCAKIGAKVLVQKTGHYDVYGYIQRADGQILYYSWGDFRGLHIDVNAGGSGGEGVDAATLSTMLEANLDSAKSYSDNKISLITSVVGVATSVATPFLRHRPIFNLGYHPGLLAPGVEAFR